MAGTLSITTEHYDEVRDYGGVSNSFPSGAVITRATYPADTPYWRRWKLRWELMPAADLSALKTAIDNNKGGADSFTWTPPGGSPIAARFIGGTFRYTANSQQTFEVTLEIEAVRPQD